MSKYLKYAAQIRPDCSTRVCGIKPSNYSSRLNQIMEMADIAIADFPGLTMADIHTVAYDGDLWKRYTGIEWAVPVNSPLPDGYLEMSRLEPAFAGN